MKGFVAPTIVETGVGSSSTVGEKVKAEGGTKVLFCADKGIINAKLPEKALQSLKNLGIDYVIFDKIVPNPRIEDIEEGINIFKDNGCDYVVSMGGGSVMDTGRFIAAISKFGGDVLDYEGKFITEVLPYICIPTTHGTGSEVSLAAVASDRKSQRKVLCIVGAAKYAILDPTLSVALPSKLAASTGMDTLTHAIESYTAIDACPLSDALCEYSLKLINESFLATVGKHYDMQATENMLMASTLAAQAFNPTGLGLCHSIAHALGGLYDVAHGVANAIMLPYVMEFNLVACRDKYAKVAELLGNDITSLSSIDAAKTAIETVRELAKVSGIPDNLDAVGIDKSKFDAIADYALKDGNINFTARKATKEEIINILETASR